MSAYAATIVALAAVALLVAAGVRIVGEHERLVVRRFGRVHAVRAPGLRFLVPGLDQPERVSMRATELDVFVRAVTRDDVAIKVEATVVLAVHDPVTSARESEPSYVGGQAAAEGALADALGDLTLADLVGRPGPAALTGRIDAAVRPWGVRVERVAITNVDVPLGPDLLAWAGR
ncbi:SPFH domain-containing protein [Actinomadura flavalba]|uniref:SPFH domain-containing protein n=1 Tax=Actinomadura flavalba TaxID=1120938 RepID=UPI00036E94B4|nr:SPFH domain-containing protein [Actinomadura flavalba]